MRMFWEYGPSQEKALRQLLGVRKVRMWFCAKCYVSHGEGIDPLFLEHYSGEPMREVWTTQIADHREKLQREHAG